MNQQTPAHSVSARPGLNPRMIIMAGAVLLITAMAFLNTAFAGQFFERDGLAIDGFDPVAYFTENKPVKGKKDFTAVYMDSTFQFASATNRDLFNADPMKYAPQYNGFCAYGVAHGAKVKIEGERFAVVDGKLYLNYDGRIQKNWEKDIPGFIKRANNEWPALK